jgi:glutathione S-transferase
MDPAMLVLHSSPGSCALAPAIVLEEIGCPYRLAGVDFASGQQRTPDFLRKNPLGRVPVLEDDGLVLTEASAIMVYLARRFPEAKLLPEDDKGLAMALSFNSYLGSTVHVAHAHGRRGARWADEESSHADMRRKVPQTMRSTMALVEEGKLVGPWVMGAQYTICDAYLFTIAGWLEGDGVPLKELPRIAAHFAAMEKRPAVQRALAAHEGLRKAG